MTLAELITALRNLEGVGGNIGDRNGGNRIVVCRDKVESETLDVELEDSFIVLKIREIE